MCKKLFLYTFNLSLRVEPVTIICDITTSLEPIAVQYSIYTSVTWKHPISLSYLYHLGVSGHFECDTGTEGKAQHADPAAEDLRVLLQDSIGRLQQDNTTSATLYLKCTSPKECLFTLQVTKNMTSKYTNTGNNVHITTGLRLGI